MKAAALRGALSDRARFGRVHVVGSLVTGDVPSTKAAALALAELTSARHVLVVLERSDELTWKSLRNVVNVHLLTPGQLNTYDVLVSDEVVFTRAALDAFVAGSRTGATATPATAVPVSSEPGTPAPAEDFGPDSHAPLADGSSPDGFPIKGNADSMLYHVPGSAFYERTEAEVWFATAAAAETAGFQLPPSQRAKPNTEQSTKEGDA
jgi:large subunit ribosomal protein L4